MAGIHDNDTPAADAISSATTSGTGAGTTNSSSRFQLWLRSYLRETGMTNVQAGEKFGVNDSLIGHYLRGTRAPTYTTLQKIRDATSLDMNTLFT